MITFTRISSLLAAVLIVTPAFAQDHACSKSVTKKLRQIGVTASDIASIEFATDSGSYGSDRILVAWISLKSCDGYLMMNLHLDCRIFDTYTRKNCKLASLPHYH